jgi:hypothetical protein
MVGVRMRVAMIMVVAVVVIIIFMMIAMVSMLVQLIFEFDIIYKITILIKNRESMRTFQ